MSTSSLHAIFKTVATELREYRNGHGTGPAIWGHLEQHYLGGDRFRWFSSDDKLWKLARDERVPLCLRACHVFTFDGAVIPPDKLAPMAELLAEGGRIIGESAPEYVNHFPTIASDLASLRLHHRAVGVGLSCTSVSDMWPRHARQWPRKPWNCYAYLTTPKEPGL